MGDLFGVSEIDRNRVNGVGQPGVDPSSQVGDGVNKNKFVNSIFVPEDLPIGFGAGAYNA